MTLVLKIVGGTLLFLVVVALLAATIVPRYLDRIYYRGERSDHFDGQRFFNPDGDADTAAPPTGGSRAGFFWNAATGRDGRPAWPDRVAVATSRPAGRVAGDRMVVTWVGHATVLIQTAGINILTDPVWSDKAGPLGLGPRRVAAPGVAFDDLPPIDLVLVSHNHYDHFDAATLKRLWARDRPVFVTSLGNDAILRGLGIDRRTGDGGGVEALDWGAVAAVGGKPVAAGAKAPGGPAPVARVVAVRSHHWGSRWFSDRNRALWSGFVVSLPGSGSIFFAGDTGMGDSRWPQEARDAALDPLRLALVPIGAFRFRPGQMESGSHIGPVDAVEVHRLLGAATTIPIHWGTFRLSYEGFDTPPRLLAAAMRCTGQSGFAPVAIGRPVEIPRYAAPAPAPPMSRRQLLACLDTPAVRAMR